VKKEGKNILPHTGESEFDRLQKFSRALKREKNLREEGGRLKWTQNAKSSARRRRGERTCRIDPEKGGPLLPLRGRGTWHFSSNGVLNSRRKKDGREGESPHQGEVDPSSRNNPFLLSIRAGAGKEKRRGRRTGA